MIEDYFNRLWYGNHPQRWLFWPASMLVKQLVKRKREQFLRAPPRALPVPVVVVGNITVGGTGKTPLLLYLIEALQSRGYKIGVISRGYGGKGPFPLFVTQQTSATACGDEPAMIVRRTGIPLVVDPDRTSAAKQLLRHASVDIILSDDGLQHYRLPRQLEILVMDGQRGVGNGQLLPMGPLREPLERLASVSMTVINGEPNTELVTALSLHPTVKTFQMNVNPGNLRRLDGAEERLPEFFKTKTIVALAGIGNPERFFNTLTAMGLSFSRVVFPDHHAFSAGDFESLQQSTLIMTEKDAVKVSSSWVSDAWYLPVDAAITGNLVDDILSILSL